MNIRRQTLFTLVRSHLNVLTNVDKRKLILISIFQSGTSILDVVGITAIGLMGTISVASLKRESEGSNKIPAIRIFGIENLSFESQTLLLAAISVTCFLSRTILSVILTKKILYFMSRRGSAISSELVGEMLSQPLLIIQQRTTQETIWLVTRGVEIIVLEVIAPSAVLLSDSVLLILMLLTLLALSPVTAISTFLIFGITGYVLNRIMRNRSEELGHSLQNLNVRSNEKIAEVFSSFRESIVRNRRDYYSQEIRKIRYELANVVAEVNFMPLISKYVFEFMIIIGAVTVCVYQFAFNDASNAFATMVIFLAASSRIAPAVLRVQQGALQIRRGISTSNESLQLITELCQISRTTKVVERESDVHKFLHIGFEPHIRVEGLSFAYSGKNRLALANLNLEIPTGRLVAIVGPTGSGKTTLVDLLLGILEPDTGTVTISGVKPKEAIINWPSAIAYVPQDIVITNGTILDNVTLGFPDDSKNTDLAWNALRIAQAKDFVDALPEGIFTKVGERGAMLSGGQRQRLGIARALFTEPKLLVLDEATSSLDGETEMRLNEALNSLRGQTTVILIAHRLSSVKNADIVVYVENSEVIKIGTFSEVLEAVPNFATQARLIGISAPILDT